MIIIANWKMNKDLDDINFFLEKFKKNLGDYPEYFFKKIKIFISPSFPFLSYMQTNLCSKKISIIAQNVFHENLGAFTGEVSVKMLKSMNIDHVIIGHSERRVYFNEDNSVLDKKVKNCLDHNLCPIFCFGETDKDRFSNNYLSIIEQQLKILPKNNVKKIILAYEPVWAIGSGKTPTLDQIKEVHSFVKQIYNYPVLYGGSLNEKNAKDIFSLNEVDGGLIGGASLCSDAFFSILKEAFKVVEFKG